MTEPRYEFWRTITPVLGEPIPTDAQWLKNPVSKASAHWCKPQCLSYMQHHLQLRWRVPVEVIPLDVAVEMVMGHAVIEEWPKCRRKVIFRGQAITADTFDALEVAVAEALRKAAK